jgi:hypothetical protein
MAAEDRRALDLEKALERELQSVAREQAAERSARAADTFLPEDYAQFNEPDPYMLPKAQDLDAVAEAQAHANTQPQPGYQDASYGPAPEAVPAPQTVAPVPELVPVSNVYQPPEFAAAAEPPPVATTSESPTAAAQPEAPAAEPELTIHHFRPQREPSIDLHYASPVRPEPRVQETQGQSRPVEVPPVAVNENRLPQATELFVRAGTSLFAWAVAAIAFIALGVAIWQTFVFQRSIAAMETNIARGQFVLACRDSIGAYYDARQKLSVLMPAADRGNIAGASRVTEYNRIEARTAIAKVSALANYLASFQDAGARVRYGELTRALNGIVDVAHTTPLSDIDRVFAPADKLFSEINDDCVRLSQNVRL